MKSCKIRRLVFVSDKIEISDNKRKVVRIHFGCPKKNQASLRPSTRGRPWELAGRGWGELHHEGAWVQVVCWCQCCLHEVEEKEKREKEKREKERKGKNGKFSKPGNFRGGGIKGILWT
jgi:hypothetical protein